MVVMVIIDQYTPSTRSYPMTKKPIISPSTKMRPGPASAAQYLNVQLPPLRRSSMSKEPSSQSSAVGSLGVIGLSSRSLTNMSASTSGESAANTNTIPTTA